MPKKILPEEYKEYFQQNYTNYELLSDYKGDKEYIMVRCKNDGNVWYTKPNWLKQNVGCQKCYDKRRGNTTRLGTDGFIEKAKKVHGDKYDYSKVDYKTNKVKVCVICPKPGDLVFDLGGECVLYRRGLNTPTGCDNSMGGHCIIGTKDELIAFAIEYWEEIMENTGIDTRDIFGK